MATKTQTRKTQARKQAVVAKSAAKKGEKKYEYEVRNGVRRPMRGTAALMWAQFDKHPEATAEEVRYAAEKFGFDPAIFVGRLYQYRRFYDIASPRVAAPAKKAAPKKAKAAPKKAAAKPVKKAAAPAGASAKRAKKATAAKVPAKTAARRANSSHVSDAAARSGLEHLFQ